MHSNQILPDNKDFQLLFWGGPRWRMAAICKIEKSLYHRNLLTNFDKIWRGDASWPSKVDQPLKFPEFQNPRWWTVAILK